MMNTVNCLSQGNIKIHLLLCVFVKNLYIAKN